MIALTRLDGSIFYLNPSLMITVEEAPDTVISLTTGTSVMVREGAEEIVDLIVMFHRRTWLSPSLADDLDSIVHGKSHEHGD
jgi:flagellar protein FlbD